MGVIASGWKNKAGTGYRSCNCGSWMQHWINCSGLPWPDQCSVLGCTNTATLGAHIYNSQVPGEKIVPACASCNGYKGEFTLKGGIRLVSANKQDSCE